MPIIKCPECGKEISDSCKKCIHCGYQFKKDLKIPLKQKTQILKNNIKKIISNIPIAIKMIILFSFFFILFIIIYVFMFFKDYQIAKDYFSMEQYGLASLKIEKYPINISGDKLFDYIKACGNDNYYIYYDMALAEISSNDTSYDKLAEYLLKGLQSTENYYANIANPSEIETMSYQAFRSKYLSKLYIYNLTSLSSNSLFKYTFIF